MASSWEQYLKNITPTTDKTYNVGSASYENIKNLLSDSGQTYSQMTMPSILPLLSTETDPYLQKAIESITGTYGESKARSLSDVGTAMQKRGLTGSSIESGALGEAAATSEKGLSDYISQLLSQSSASNKSNLLNYLQSAYGIDYQTDQTTKSNLAQLMSDELNRQTELEMLDKSLEAQDTSFWEDFGPSLISSAPAYLKLLGV